MWRKVWVFLGLVEKIGFIRKKVRVKETIGVRIEIFLGKLTGVGGLVGLRGYGARGEVGCWDMIWKTILKFIISLSKYILIVFEN